MKDIEAELWFVFSIIIGMWLLGFVLHLGGFIHLLLLPAVLIFLINLFSNRKSISQVKSLKSNK
jgi:hypothetical protein